ncbi:hypothetical protein [Metamycoplasma buccale]|uniref:hypothetical protein n=1 Tax=Metamycoplasma buccale TaxID=55602 RepID=UPI00398F49FC
MLVYDNKIKDKNYVEIANKTKESTLSTLANCKWFRFLRVFLQLLINVLIAITTSLINTAIPGTGLFLDFFLSQGTDLLFNFIFNGKIDWKEYGITSLFNSIPFITKGFKYIKNFRSNNKILSLADNIRLRNSEFKKSLLTSAKDLNKFGSKTTLENKLLVPNYRFFETHNAKLLDTLKTASDFQTTYAKSLASYRNFEQGFKFFRKSFSRTRNIVSLFSSPRYAGKKLIDIILKKPKQLLTKKWNAWVTPKVKEIFRIGKKTLDESLKDISLNSSWLDSVKIYQSNNPWDLKVVNALVRFQPNKTNNKEPVLLWQKNINNITNLILANSPGKYYLDNFAWGWEIGKIIRLQSAFFKVSKIPIFSNFIGTLAYSARTIQSIVKNFKKDNWLWNQSKDKLLSEVWSGIRENTGKGWNFKYLKGAIAIGRSFSSGNSFYVIQRGLRVGNRRFFYKHFKNKLVHKQFSRRKLLKRRIYGNK